MDMECKTPKNSCTCAHGDGEPPKTLDASYVKHVNYSFDNPEKSSLNFIMRDTLDQHEYFRDYRLSQKGKHLWDQIRILQWFAWDACLKCDYTCCSKIEGLHLPFQCKFNDNKTLASYAKGNYDYYDVEKI